MCHPVILPLLGVAEACTLIGEVTFAPGSGAETATAGTLPTVNVKVWLA
jgi:hypothetical protein